VITGRPPDSVVIDKGSDLAAAVGFGARTAVTDKYPDTGRVDLRDHGTLLYPSQATMIIGDAALTIGSAAITTATVSVTLQHGLGSDGLNPGLDYAEVVLFSREGDTIG
jgi:hypothetical protein